jgi:hypothetical protein
MNAVDLTAQCSAESLYIYIYIYIYTYIIRKSPRRYPYFDVVAGLCGHMIPRAKLAVACATGRASHARQVKGDDPNKKRDTLALQVGGWA